MRFKPGFARRVGRPKLRRSATVAVWHEVPKPICRRVWTQGASASKRADIPSALRRASAWSWSIGTRVRVEVADFHLTRHDDKAVESRRTALSNGVSALPARIRYDCH